MFSKKSNYDSSVANYGGGWGARSRVKDRESEKERERERDRQERVSAGDCESERTVRELQLKSYVCGEL